MPRIDTANFYPISRIVTDLVEASGLNTSDFVRLLGYRRVNSALRELSRWVRDGEGDPLFIARLKDTFPKSTFEINEAVSRTDLIKRKEAEDRAAERLAKICQHHRPVLVVQTHEERPGMLVFYSLFGSKWKCVPLPLRIRDLPEERAFPIIKWTIKRYLRTFRGDCPLWGPARGFLYSRTAESGFLFDLNGKMIGSHEGLPDVLGVVTSTVIDGKQIA